ncbi:MAG: DUF1573 domain-containing protein [Bacteroidales bacterium]
MKRIILSFAVIVFSSFTISAQVATKADADKKAQEQERIIQQKKQQEIANQQQAEAQANNPNAPIAEFEKLVHDYGTIEQHGDGNCEFRFTNTGKEPLILSNVRSSCGCTVPTWPRQPVLPGQSEVIKVKYDTKRVGTINKSITVYSNGKVSPISLKIKGNILAATESQMPTKEVEQTGAPINKTSK